MKILFSIFTLICFHVWSQNTTQIEKVWAENPTVLHSSYKNNFDFFDDSLFKNSTKKWKSNLLPTTLFALENKEFKTILGVQFLTYYKFSSKFDLKLFNELAYTNTKVTPYASVLQGKAFFKNVFDSSVPIYNDIRFRFSYKANSIFQIQSGIDKHFIGEGDRSVLMGNQGVANPFVLAKVNFWKFEYFTLQQIMREGFTNHYLPKANSTHYLNFNHKNKISFGIFESVQHIIKDTIYNRAYEVEYLNPLIFYRPQEYSLGSSDNVLLGLNGFITWKKNKLYGQLIIDDINVAEIKAKTQYWAAAKYGIQAGFKTWITISKTPVFFRTEFNLVSPFTYSANNLNATFSNQGLPLAHALGGNFIEWYNEFSFQVNTINVHAWAQYYVKGNDPAASILSFGGDIFKPYKYRAHGDYGYYLGNGERSHSLQLGTNISKTIQKYRTSIFVEPRLFLIKNTPEIKAKVYFTLGIQSLFGKDKRNY